MNVNRFRRLTRWRRREKLRSKQVNAQLMGSGFWGSRLFLLQINRLAGGPSAPSTSCIPSAPPFPDTSLVKPSAPDVTSPHFMYLTSNEDPRLVDLARKHLRTRQVSSTFTPSRGVLIWWVYLRHYLTILLGRDK
eukprot:GHVN01106203.1.p1 GENE.GHVN01106203.1~~GHVN01106203.1.p1  ORF type:complete len:135 (+),score=16.73 GHVN01106203.1:532-936(+)